MKIKLYVYIIEIKTLHKNLWPSKLSARGSRENQLDDRPAPNTHAYVVFDVSYYNDYTCSFSEIEPSFPYRDVTVRRGVEFKDDYDIQAELGR